MGWNIITFGEQYIGYGDDYGPTFPPVSPSPDPLAVARYAPDGRRSLRSVSRKIRWPTTDGKPVCPRCGSVEAYEFKTRRIFKCKAFPVSGPIIAMPDETKMAIRLSSTCANLLHPCGRISFYDRLVII